MNRFIGLAIIFTTITAINSNYIILYIILYYYISVRNIKCFNWNAITF